MILGTVRPELPALTEQTGVSPRVAEAVEERLDDVAVHIGADDKEEDVAEIVTLERPHGAVLRRKRELLGQFARERRISDETTRILRACVDLEKIRRNGCLPYKWPPETVLKQLGVVRGGIIVVAVIADERKNRQRAEPRDTL